MIKEFFLCFILTISFASAIEINPSVDVDNIIGVNIKPVAAAINYSKIIINLTSNNTIYHEGLTAQQVADLYSETDPIYSAWDKDYDDLTSRPLDWDGSYWDFQNNFDLNNYSLADDGSDIIYNSGGTIYVYSDSMYSDYFYDKGGSWNWAYDTGSGVQVQAYYYCDQNGGNCFYASDVGGGLSGNMDGDIYGQDSYSLYDMYGISTNYLNANDYSYIYMGGDLDFGNSYDLNNVYDAYISYAYIDYLQGNGGDISIGSNINFGGSYIIDNAYAIRTNIYSNMDGNNQLVYWDGSEWDMYETWDGQNSVTIEDLLQVEAQYVEVEHIKSHNGDSMFSYNSDIYVYDDMQGQSNKLIGFGNITSDERICDSVGCIGDGGESINGTAINVTAVYVEDGFQAEVSSNYTYFNKGEDIGLCFNETHIILGEAITGQCG